MFSRLKQSNRAFTLIELLVVILIIAILIAIAAPLFLGQQDKAHDSVALQQLAISRKVVKAEWTSAGQTGYKKEDGSAMTAEDIVAAMQASEPQATFVVGANGAAPNVQSVTLESSNSVTTCIKSKSSKGEVFCFKTYEDGGAIFASNGTGPSAGIAYAADAKPIVANSPTTCWVRGETEDAARAKFGSSPTDPCIGDVGEPPVTGDEWCDLNPADELCTGTPTIFHDAGINAFLPGTSAEERFVPQADLGINFRVTRTEGEDEKPVDSVHVYWQYCPAGQGLASSTTCLNFTPAQNGGNPSGNYYDGSPLGYFDWTGTPSSNNKNTIAKIGGNKLFTAPATSPLPDGGRYEVRAVVSTTINANSKTYVDTFYTAPVLIEAAEELPEDPDDVYNDHTLTMDNVFSNDIDVTGTARITIPASPAGEEGDNNSRNFSTYVCNDTVPRTAEGVLEWVGGVNHRCTEIANNVVTTYNGTPNADGSVNAYNLPISFNHYGKFYAVVARATKTTEESNYNTYDTYTRVGISPDITEVNYSEVTNYETPEVPSYGAEEPTAYGFITGGLNYRQGIGGWGEFDNIEDFAIDFYAPSYFESQTLYAHHPKVFMDACELGENGSCVDTGLSYEWNPDGNYSNGSYELSAHNGSSATFYATASQGCSINGNGYAPYYTDYTTHATFEGAAVIFRPRLVFYRHNGEVLRQMIGGGIAGDFYQGPC